MSDRLLEAYLAKDVSQLRERILNLPWNKKHMARMHKAGQAYNNRHHASNEICPNCHKSDMLIFLETPELKHYGKMVCTRCKSGGAPEGKYLRWVPYPMGLGDVGWKA